VRYTGPLRAPVEKGDEVAVLRVVVPGQPARDLPLVAAENVGPAGPAARLRNGLFGLVGL
jgi:D-alanyl-D-alanine carboxypeptidase (penicillin-binding protein 5/6)